jgi:hypothetical protein
MLSSRSPDIKSESSAFNRLRKKSPFACFEGGLIAAVKADLAGERAVWGAFGGASAEGGIHLVETLPGEAYPVRAVAAVEIAFFLPAYSACEKLP